MSTFDVNVILNFLTRGEDKNKDAAKTPSLRLAPHSPDCRLLLPVRPGLR